MGRPVRQRKQVCDNRQHGAARLYAHVRCGQKGTRSETVKMRFTIWLTAFVIGALSATVSLSAQPLSRVSKLNITSRRPAFGGRSFGTAGQYEILIGKAQAQADGGAQRADDKRSQP